MNIVAIVQTRMGATRLPGKVLMDLCGKPVIWHVVDRLKYSKLINKIVVATTASNNDDAIEEFCRKHNIDFYRGSEEDVLDRYYQAARIYEADVIVRITADCPLIDPEIVDKIVREYLDRINSFDGASNTIKHTYPRGLDTEVISFPALEKCWNRAEKKYHREHVTIYIYEHPELFKLFSAENKDNLSSFRWTVDEKADLKFVRELYKRLYQEKKLFLMEDILDILEKEPYLLKINENVKQKSLR